MSSAQDLSGSSLFWQAMSAVIWDTEDILMVEWLTQAILVNSV
jgi:hypothetical protein